VTSRNVRDVDRRGLRPGDQTGGRDRAIDTYSHPDRWPGWRPARDDRATGIDR
jgi:hypothetical protein